MKQSKTEKTRRGTLVSIVGIVAFAGLAENRKNTRTNPTDTPSPHRRRFSHTPSLGPHHRQRADDPVPGGRDERDKREDHQPMHRRRGLQTRTRIQRDDLKLRWKRDVQGSTQPLLDAALIVCIPRPSSRGTHLNSWRNNVEGEAKYSGRGGGQ